MTVGLYRDELEPGQAYYSLSDGLYFWSPDGIGVFWYDTLEELEEQHGEQETDVITVDHLKDY